MGTIMRQIEQTEMIGQPEMAAFDLLVLAANRRRGLRRLLTGNMPERMLSSISLPLLVVRPPEAATATPSHTEEKRSPGSGEN
jgi:nucleotide-binding universal stress UspA family protein